MAGRKSAAELSELMERAKEVPELPHGVRLTKQETQWAWELTLLRVEWEPAEMMVICDIARNRTKIAAMEKEIRKDGYTDYSEKGGLKAHPLIDKVDKLQARNLAFMRSIGLLCSDKRNENKKGRLIRARAGDYAEVGHDKSKENDGDDIEDAEFSMV